MSCEGMDCRGALDRLWALVDRELDDATAAEVRAHLDECQSCYPQYDFHRAYRAFVAGHCRQSAPPDVRRRVFMRLLEEDGEA